jgi:transcriptional regulator with XRE-family HTH domain
MAHQKQALAVSDFCEALGNRIHEQRLAKRLSIEQLSHLSGIAAASLERYESGAACPFADEALAVADALGISLDALLGRE